MVDFINWDYVEERICRYNHSPSDDLLYRIGTHVDVLTLEDCSLIVSQDRQDGTLTPEQRFRVLNWIVSSQNTVELKCDELECDLALLIFGREQLTQWLERSRQAYPNFEFYLVFEYHDSQQSGWESGINYSLYWKPKVGAPIPSVEMDFPHELYWESGEMFWADWMPEGNQFGLILDSYPRQASFTDSCGVCLPEDCYTTPTDEEADLMSVAQVLEHFKV